MTAREGRVSLGNDKKMFLNVVKAEEPCEYTKIHRLVCFKWANGMIM